MKKEFMESSLEVIMLDSTNIICTSVCAKAPAVDPDDTTELDI